MSGLEHSTLSVSLHTGAGLWLVCHTYDDVAPIVSMASTGVHLNISPSSRSVVTAGDVATARDLVKAASTYLRECERLAAISTPQMAA